MRSGRRAAAERGGGGGVLRGAAVNFTFNAANLGIRTLAVKLEDMRKGIELFDYGFRSSPDCR